MGFSVGRPKRSVFSASVSACYRITIPAKKAFRPEADKMPVW
jgi:hypothetical protein